MEVCDARLISMYPRCNFTVRSLEVVGYVGYSTPGRGCGLRVRLGPGLGDVDHAHFRESVILHDPRWWLYRISRRRKLQQWRRPAERG